MRQKLAGILAWWLTLTFFSAHSHAELGARLEATFAEPGPFWTGQRIIVNLDLLSDGFQFSDQRFEIPALRHGLALPPQSATLNFTRRIDGATWQGLRYELSVFALQPGALELPSFPVRFKVAAGYGTQPQAFSFATPELSALINQPPGMPAGTPVITSTRFELKIDREPDQTRFTVGNALTLHLTRRAVGVPGAAFPAIPMESTEGISIHIAAPEIRDRTDRGALDGFRLDRITLQLERPGRFTLPGYTAHWFDPVAQVLHTERQSDFSFEVSPGPDAVGSAPVPPLTRRVNQPFVTILLLSGIAALGWRLLGPGVRRAWRDRQARRAASEAGRYRAVLAACQRNDARGADLSLLRWIRIAEPAYPCASDYAARHSVRLAEAVATLQSALRSPGTPWQGSELSTALGALRRRRQSRQESPALPALNPH